MHRWRLSVGTPSRKRLKGVLIMRHRQAKGIAGGPGRRAAAVLGAGSGLLAVLLASCQFDSKQYSTSWMDRFRPFQGANLSELVLIDVALIERPVLDPYISQELWDLADEQIVPLERKALLEDNGFRVGQVGGITPPGLQALLTSERSCANPHRLTTRAGTVKDVTLGPAAPASRFQIHEDGQAETVELEQAEFQFSMTPTLTKEGQVTLRFTPKVRYGELEHRARATADRSGLVLQSERPLRTFEALGWEVTVPTNAYVLIGARTDRQDSLGFQSFVRREETRPVQRLLVIRTTRAEPGIAREYGPSTTPRTR